MGRPRLSVTVITLDEERNIERCLRSVAGLADEQLVVDSGSSDRTVERAEALGARVIVNPWPGHKQQKQFAVDEAAHDWILSLDADEWITPELRREISGYLAGAPAPDTRAIERVNKFLGRYLRNSDSGDWKVRLFHRRIARWGGVNPHDHVERLDGRASLRLRQPFFHDSVQTLSRYMQTVNSYTSIAADAPEAKPFRLHRLLLNPPARFLKSYLLKQGFRDGLHGLVYAGCEAIYAFVKYAKSWEKVKPPPQDDPGAPDRSAEDQ